MSNLSAEEWALLQTFRLDFCKHYCNLSGHVSGCIDGGRILEKLRELPEWCRICVRDERDYPSRAVSGGLCLFHGGKI